MDDLALFLLSRPVIIALAITGAIVATIGSMLMREGSPVAPQKARVIMIAGYVVTGLSMLGFIAAGFLSDA
jgi:hypothetical protein